MRRQKSLDYLAPPLLSALYELAGDDLNFVPVQPCRDIFADSRGDNNLLKITHRLHQSLTTPSIQLSEDIIEKNHGITGRRLSAKDISESDFKGERE